MGRVKAVKVIVLRRQSLEIAKARIVAHYFRFMRLFDGRIVYTHLNGVGREILLFG